MGELSFFASRQTPHARCSSPSPLASDDQLWHDLRWPRRWRHPPTLGRAAARPFPSDEAFDVLRKQLGVRDLSQVFETISLVPVASASIGQSSRRRP